MNLLISTAFTKLKVFSEKKHLRLLIHRTAQEVTHTPWDAGAAVELSWPALVKIISESSHMSGKKEEWPIVRVVSMLGLRQQEATATFFASPKTTWAPSVLVSSTEEQSVPLG